MKKLAIVTTHPIQYYAPVFQLLHQRNVIAVKVFYTWGSASVSKFDPGFNKTIEWDLPLLENYPFAWVRNTSKTPGSHHFAGIITPDLVSQINDFKPDAILVIGWSYKSHLKAIRYFHRKRPVYFRGDSTLLDEKRGLKSSIRYCMLQWVYSHIDHAFYAGTNNKNYFKKYGLKDEQLSFAPHAVDNERFGIPRHEEAIGLRHQLGLSPADLLVLFAGKFELKKDPLLLLRALLQFTMPNLHLLMVGNGPLESELKKQARGSPNIHFLAVQNQSYMPVIYQACDLFCLPSKGSGETWGLAVNEAMACGKPVLVSDKVGCAIDLVVENYNGCHFRSGDLNDILSKLRQLTGEPGKLEAYGVHSLALIKNYSFNHIAAAIETQVLNEKNRQD